MVELLIVTVILSVTALALYFTLSSGLRIYRRVSLDSADQELAFFLDKFAFDIRNSLVFSGIDFTGTDTKVSFPALVYSQGMRERSAGQVEYYYDSKDAGVFRLQRDIWQVSNKKDGDSKKVLNNVKKFNLQYYVYDKDKKEYVWEDEFSDDKPLVSVRLAFGFEEDPRTIVKGVNIPISLRP